MVEEEREVLQDVGRTPEAKVVEDLISYELNEASSDRFFLTSANLKEQKRIEFIEFLKANIEVFAWIPYKMPRIDPDFIEHKLNVILEAYLIKQGGRRSTPLHVDVMIKEMETLKEVSAITKIFYPNWLSNIVVVTKKTGKWGVYVDFTSLNRTFQKTFSFA